jgi:GMP synthase-like glutamine amidotransferase
MGFWDLSDGETAKETGTEYEVAGGNSEPIPNNSDVLASVKNVKWETVKDGVERFINIQWTHLKVSKEGQKLFQNWRDLEKQRSIMILTMTRQ